MTALMLYRRAVLLDPADRVVQTFPGGTERDRVDPAGTSDPAVNAGGLLRNFLVDDFFPIDLSHRS